MIESDAASTGKSGDFEDHDCDSVITENTVSPIVDAANAVRLVNDNTESSNDVADSTKQTAGMALSRALDSFSYKFYG